MTPQKNVDLSVTAVAVSGVDLVQALSASERHKSKNLWDMCFPTDFEGR